MEEAEPLAVPEVEQIAADEVEPEVVESEAVVLEPAEPEELAEDEPVATEQEVEELRDKLYSQYYSLYADAVKNGNTFVAKQVLDSIAKVFAVAPDKKVDIQVADNKVNISFGFDTE